VTSEQTPPAFALPAALLSQGFVLRPETDADVDFLMRVYASTREEELAPVPWSAEAKRTFLASQFQAQRHHYRTYFADTAFDVLEERGEPAGRLYLQARRTQLYIVDITLLPPWRGRGIGTAILQALQAAGRASGKMICHRICSSDAPSILAASDSSRGIPRKNWRKRKMKNALPKKQGTMSGRKVLVQCSFENMMNKGTMVT